MSVSSSRCKEIAKAVDTGIGPRRSKGPTKQLVNRNFTIRQLTESELRDMVELWKRARLSFRPKGRDRISSLRLQLSRDPEMFVGAFADGKMIAAAIGSDDGRRAWINRLAVDPSHRRKGVALAMIEHFERVFRRRGRRLFCAHIEADNRPSMRLFEKAGYRRQTHIIYYAKRERPDY